MDVIDVYVVLDLSWQKSISGYACNGNTPVLGLKEVTFSRLDIITTLHTA